MPSFDSEIRDQAYQFFIQEALEFLQVLETGLLTLRQDHSIAQVHALMRAAHSIKGGAASLDLTAIDRIAHRLEDVLRALYSETVTIDLPLEELLLQAYDCLRSPLMAEIETGQHDGDAAIARSEPIFAQLETSLGDAMTTEQDLPTAAELGIDIVQAIFAGDVQAGLIRLETVLAYPETEEVLGEFRAQAEVFIGVGELVNLPGFVAIARATIAALAQAPAQAEAIGQLALEDFRAAQQTVLAGDRTIGGQPSPALLNWGQTLDRDADRHTADLQADSLNWVEGESLSGAFNPELDHDFLSSHWAAMLLEGSMPLGNAEDYTDVDRDLDAALYPEQSDLEADSFALTDWLTADEAEDQTTAAIGAWLDSSNPTLPEAPEAEQFWGTDAQFEQTPISSPLSEAIDRPAAKPASPSQSAESNPPHLITTGPIATEPAATEPAIKLQSAARPAATATQLAHVVRVDLHRLDRLNNLVGELVTQENSTILKHQQIQQILNRLLSQFQNFEQLSKGLQDWSDSSHRVSARLGSSQPVADFDPLQLDSYHRLYPIVQDAQAEISQLGEAMRDLTLLTQQLQQTQRKKQQTLKQVRDDLLWARMLPLGDLLQRFPRMVRDLSAKYGKQVSLKLTGANTLVDKAILEKLYDPLVHLVRNAFDHGIESAEMRQAQGKPAEATIEIRAYHRGNQTYIEVHDDGKGIDPERLRAKAIDLYQLSTEAAAALTVEALHELLFTPGFSTAAQVSELSGRGVGLDTVRSQVKALKGAILLTSESGQGSTFTLRLPLTLTITKLLVFGIGSHLMAIPVDALASIVMAADHDIESIHGQLFYRWHDRLIPVYSRSVFTYSHLPIGSSEALLTRPRLQTGQKPLLLITDETQTIALQVDQILHEQELVIKPFSNAIAPPAYLYGCTILGDGSLLPVIDGQALLQLQDSDRAIAPALPIRMALGAALNPELSSELSSELSPASSPEPSDDRQTVLIVDDSLTTRQSLALTLKKAGYRTLQARDGREAIAHLQQNTVQAVFCDVEMPEMNGFEFLSHCRQQFPKAILPIIMLTSRSGSKHRQIAEYMGASSYLTKPYLEHQLLQTLHSHLTPEHQRA